MGGYDCGMYLGGEVRHKTLEIGQFLSKFNCSRVQQNRQNRLCRARILDHLYSSNIPNKEKCSVWRYINNTHNIIATIRVFFDRVVIAIFGYLLCKEDVWVIVLDGSLVCRRGRVASLPLEQKNQSMHRPNSSITPI